MAKLVYLRKMGGKRRNRRASGYRKRVSHKKTLPYKARSRRYGPKHIKVKSYGISTSFDKIALRPNKFGTSMKKKYWVGSKNIFQTNYTSQITTAGTTANNQDSTSVYWFGQADMNAALQAYSLGQSANGNTNNTNRIFWNKVTGEVLMTNSSNANIEIDIYSFSTKRDSINSPGALWRLGLNDEAAQTTNDLTQRNFGVTPLDSVALTTMYKAFKVTHISLTPGQSHRHGFTQHLCRPVNNELLYNDVNGGDVAMRGITCAEVIVVRGFPCSTADAANVGITPARVDMIIDKKYEFKYIFDLDTSYKSSMPTLGVTSQQIYNQGSGSVAVPTVL